MKIKPEHYEHMVDNTTVRYAPTVQLIADSRGKYHYAQVQGYVIHPPGQHPKDCPLVASCTAIEFKTEYGSRWWDCGKAWINSELRVVASGFDMRNELVNKWEVVKEGR